MKFIITVVAFGLLTIHLFGQVSFSLCSTPGVASSTFWVAAADVNGDGAVDLISASFYSGTLSILTNNGSGIFTEASAPSVGSEPTSIAAADLWGNGNVELISANYGANTLSILTNGGGGVFQESAVLPVGSSPHSVIAVDVNGDDKPDLISANFGDGTLSVLTNNGTGGFVVASTPRVGSGPYCVTAADLNGDGVMDLIVANYYDNTLTVLTNNGGGGFLLAATLPAGNNPISVAASDVNGDGHVDLICANYHDNTLTIFTNNGSGGFAVAATPAVGSTPIGVAATDVNGDGAVDLISVNSADDTFTVLTNNGAGVFSLAATPAAGNGPSSMAVADVNGDGKMDLISANYNVGALTVMTNGTLYPGLTLAAIFAQPVSRSFNLGSLAILSVSASAFGQTLSYQWQFDGANIVNATNLNLIMPDAQMSNSGYYDVIISDSYGSVTSSIASIFVYAPGAPSVFVNSGLVILSNSVVGNALISFVPGFTNGLLLYTLDGSDPEEGDGIFYDGPFTVTNSTIIRAADFSADFSQSAEMLPLALLVGPGFEVSTSVVGGGTVELGSNVNWFASNSVITATAVASQNWMFDHWQGAVTTNGNPLTLTVNSNLSLQAVFTLADFPVTLTTTGGGTVAARGLHTTDGTNFAVNSVVSLVATSNPGWTFLGWQGGIVATYNPDMLIITQAISAQGIFGTGLETNAAEGGQIVANTTNLVAYGSNVTVSAVANNGDYFVAWSGSVAGTNSPVITPVTNGFETINALFLPLPENKFSLSVAVLGNGMVNFSPQKNFYNPGDVVTLTATPDSPATTFYGWLGGDNYTNLTTTVTMLTNLIVYANFAGSPPTSTAQATALINSGSCSAAVLTSGGFGYTNVPAVAIVGGGGSGATAVAVMQAGIVVAVNIVSAGSGYTNSPQIIIEPPVVIPPQLGTEAASDLIFSNLTVSANYLLQKYVNQAWTNLRQNFTATNPVMTQWVKGAAGPNTYQILVLPLPVTATAVPITSYGYVVFVTVTSGGSGYLSTPAVTIVGGGGSGATAMAVISNGVVTAVNMTNPGSGYTNAPVVMIAPQPLDPIPSKTQPGILLSMSDLMTNQIYQLQYAAQLDDTWSNATNGYFIPTNIVQSEYLCITNASGYYRLQYSP